MLGRPACVSPIATRSAASIAAAALRHFPSFGKIQKRRVDGNAARYRPAEHKLVKIRVHIDFPPNPAFNFVEAVYRRSSLPFAGLLP
jgi:hypothetical protein